MAGKSEPLPPAQSTFLTGLFLITEDGLGIASQVAEALQQQGATTAILSTDLLGNSEQLEQKIAQLRTNLGQIKGIVHLASLTAIPLPEDLSTWRQLTAIQSKSLFYLLKICANDLKESGGQVLAASLLGGNFGRNRDCNPGLPLGGSSSGLLKTMMIEWSGVRGKAVDFNNNTSSNTIATAIVEELISQDSAVEIGYPQQQRTIFEGVDIPVEIVENNQESITLTSDSVVFCIGGARGITAEVVRELIVPGMTLILIGRSPEPQPESPLTRNVEDINQLRRILIQLVQEKGEKPTPAQIEKDLKQLQQERSINSNLESFRQAGAKVEYYGVDVRDDQAFGSLIESIYQRYGKIDAVIQGAGIIQDKLIVDKTTASFDQVFDTKVDSTFILARYLRPESLKLAILFASVAGRTGNRGQCDYAAANEVVNRFAWWMATHWSNTRVFSINWGPWDITGMASEEVNRQFRARGVIPIPPAAGCKFVLDELLYGTKADVELVTGFFKGTPTESMTANGEQGRQGDEETGRNSQKLSSLPLLTSSPQIQPNSVVTLEETISLANHPYLRDHRLDGKPVLAAACALELLAEFVQASWSDWVVCEVHDLRILRGIKLETDNGQLVRLQARASTHADAESLLVTAEIAEATGKGLHYRGNFLLRPQFEPSPVIDLPDLGAGNALNIEKAYRDYCFHGELFQLITEIDNFNTQGINGNFRASNPSLWLNRQGEKTNWLFDPGVLDASLQMALIYARIHGDTSALPSRFGRVIRYRPLIPDSSLRIKFRINTFEPTTIIYDALLYGEDGSIYLQLKDMEGSCSKALNRLVSHV